MSLYALLIIRNISVSVNSSIDWSAISKAEDFKKVPVFMHMLMVNAEGNAQCIFFYMRTLRADQKNPKSNFWKTI